jgi:hypothetical protein
MNITLTLSTEQETALTRSNVSANPDERTRPRLEVFVQGVLYAKVAEHIRAWADRDAATVTAKLAKSVTTMSKEDRETVTAILDKYQLPVPAEVEPIVDPIVEPIIEEPLVP